MSSGVYVNTTPSNSQLTFLGSTNAATTIGMSTGAMRVVRGGSGSAFGIRNANFTASTLYYEFEFNPSAASGTNSNVFTFWVGNGFSNSSSGNPSNIFGTFNIAISSTIGPAWRINNAGTAYTGNRKIVWVLNRSGSTITYKAPTGADVTLAANSHDVWVNNIGTSTATRELNNSTTGITSTQAMQNFGFRSQATGTNTYNLDNMLVDTVPRVIISNAASSITSNSFTANWTAIAGVTGYRLDVATDAAFTNLVSGYANLYVSGASTNSQSITGLGGGTYYYRVRGVMQYTVNEIAGGVSTSQTVSLSCINPTINTQPSTANQTVCVGNSLTALNVSATGATSYQWYSNATNSNIDGNLISGATNASYTPSTTSSSTLYYYCIVSSGITCNVPSDPSGLITVNTLPTVSFTSAPSGTVAINSNQTYTTQAGFSNYNWTFTGTLGVDYSLVSGGTSADNSAVVTWLTAGNKTVTVNYQNANGCTAASAASNTITVSASVFYNKPNSDVTVLSNWGTAVDGTGTNPTNFTNADQTFNLFNIGATISTTWDVQGVGTKVVIGDGINAVSFIADNAFTATVVDVSNNATLHLQTTTIPTFGTLAAGSTVNYSGSAITQVVTPTSYSNLTLSGSGSRTFSGTTSISGVFNPGNGFSATAGTIVLNGISDAQVIPGNFTYNSLSVSGADGKSTTGNLNVNATLTMNNSFALSTADTLVMGTSATMSSTASKVLTVNGTFELTQNSLTFTAGNGSISVAAGGIFKMSGTVSNSAYAFTNVNFTSGIGVAGSTLYIATTGCPRIPSSPFNGNLTYDLATTSGGGIVNILNTTPVIVTGNMNILNTGGNIITHASGGSPRALTVQGNLNMSGAARYDVSANGSTGACSLTINGNININNSTDTLYTNNASSTGGTGVINVLGNLNHSAGIIGRGANSNATGTLAFTGTSMQDIATIGIMSNTNITLNNTNGARLLTDLVAGSTLTFSSGRLRTNGFSVILSGTTSSISGASSSSYIATCDAAGTPSTTGGLTIQNVGSGGRTGTISFPIGTSSSYNPATVNNSSSAVAFTARVNTTPFAGTTIDSTVARTWNIQPASGTPNAIIGLQWNASEEGANFNRNSSSVARLSGGVTAEFSNGGVANGSNPYVLNSGSTLFNNFGDFGLIPGIVIPADEPNIQATNVSIIAANTTMNISWTAGNGANSIVVVRQGSAVTLAPTDGSIYADGNGVFGNGSNLGTNNFVAYIGSGNSFTLTGFVAGTNYHVAVYSFNGNNGTENYLTTSPATANATTGIPTYYYVGGTGNTSNNFATANMWATTLGGTPLSGFSPTNNDVFVFDGSNIGGGVSDSVTISFINSSSTVGRVLLLNNARVNFVNSAGGTRTMTIGNAANPSNTTSLNVPSGSRLYFSGSNAINLILANNSSASISGLLYLGNSNSNVTLVPGSTGSNISVNTGAYVEVNGSSNSSLPFGTSSTPLVNFASGTIYRQVTAGDVFGGSGNNAVSFASGSTFWYANTGNSSAQTLSGRTFSNVIVTGNWSPTGASTGFSIDSISMPTTGVTLTLSESGNNNNIRGSINVATGATFRFNNGSAATYNFSGTSLQRITINGTWNLSSSLNLNLIVSNSAGVSLAGATNISSVASTSLTINSGCNLDLASGALNIAGGTLNLLGTLTRTSGTINGSNTGAVINIVGVSSLPSGLFTSNNVRTLTINRNAGVSIGGDVTISTALNLTSGIVDMGSNTLTISSAATVNRTNGWINGNLRKNVASGSNVARSFEVGDAANFTPVALNFTSVSSGGDVVVRSQTPANAYTNFGTAPISTTNYINRYYSVTNATAITYTNYAATFNYSSADKIGTADENTVRAARYTGSSWTSNPTTSASANQNTVSNMSAFGIYILADTCIVVTPSITISTASDTVCSGNEVMFTAIGQNAGTSPQYTWRKNSTIVGTGSTISFAAGTLTTGDTIRCILTANNNCQTTATANSNSIRLFVNQSPIAASIVSQFGTVTTNFTLCTLGQKVSLYPTPTLGIWSSSNPSVLSVANTAPAAAVATAHSNGVANINYTLTTPNTNCTTTSIIAVKVSAANPPLSVNGANSVCVGSTTTYTNAINGGVWSTLGRATINAAGMLTGTSSGATEVRYTVTNVDGCSAFSSKTITVNALPSIPNIIYAPGTTNPQSGAPAGSFCRNRTFTLVGIPSGGVWSSGGVASVNGSGVVTLGSSTGLSTVTYTFTNVNGCVNSRTISGNVVACASRGVANTNQLAENNFIIYPNPAKSVVNVLVEKFINGGSIVLTDLLGKQVVAQPLSIGNNRIDVSKLSKGIYLINITSDQGRETKKIVVE
jgi:hypothetical protein